MQYRRALIGVVASASLLGTIGVAHATHQSDPNYSPCRPGPVPGETRIGYSDAGGQDDPRRELPTVYANGDPTTATGYVGVCGGGGGTDPDVQYIEVGRNPTDGPYVDNSEPTLPLSEPVVGVDGLGSINKGEDYVEVDGAENNPGVGPITQLDGYASVGLEEDNNLTGDPADDGPGVCASGNYNRAYYETQPQQKDCNEKLLTNQLPAD